MIYMINTYLPTSIKNISKETEKKNNKMNMKHM